MVTVPTNLRFIFECCDGVPRTVAEITQVCGFEKISAAERLVEWTQTSKLGKKRYVVVKGRNERGERTYAFTRKDDGFYVMPNGDDERLPTLEARWRKLPKLRPVIEKSYVGASVDGARNDTPEDLEAILDELDEKEETRIREAEIPETEKEQLMRARRGQGIFKVRVEEIETACRLTGVTDKAS